MITRRGTIFVGALILSLSASPALVHAMGGGMGQSDTMSGTGHMGQAGMMGASGNTGIMGGESGDIMQTERMGQAGMMGASGSMGQARSSGREVFHPGWNLAGNTGTTAISVTTTFGSNASPVQGVTSNLLTIWKWDASSAGWQFYAPSLDSVALADYAVSKGYAVLTTINPGDGYWVNAIGAFLISNQIGDPFAAPPATGAAPDGDDPFVLSHTNLMKGWNLVATGVTMHPRQLNASLDSTPPALGESMQNFQTLWAWDIATNRWFFYAPSLDSGGTAMMDYANSKGYFDFTAQNKSLGRGMGFWVNMR